MIERVHEHITGELGANARTDTIFVLTAIILNLIALGINSGIAAADVMIGWIYGIAAVGLILNAPWAYKLAWIPGVIMVYHSLSFWFWVGNQNKLGHSLITNRIRITWFTANFVTGVFAILIAWRF